MVGLLILLTCLLGLWFAGDLLVHCANICRGPLERGPFHHWIFFTLVDAPYSWHIIYVMDIIMSI